jgi:hypothetical protein
MATAIKAAKIKNCSTSAVDSKLKSRFSYCEIQLSTWDFLTFIMAVVLRKGELWWVWSDCVLLVDKTVDGGDGGLGYLYAKPYGSDEKGRYVHSSGNLWCESRVLGINVITGYNLLYRGKYSFLEIHFLRNSNSIFLFFGVALSPVCLDDTISGMRA